ncbi:MAG TPA: outer membrane beta-barrel protein, partial [Cyclobacteriaceae bacterium]|nr:outer membrane beta-barrel protein [Cyclobacteriaceae bacterium]
AALAQGETRIGIKAGITSANVFGPDLNQLSTGGDPSSFGGFHLGVYVNSKLRNHFWIKSEVLTTQKGAVLQIKDKWGQHYASNFKSQYIDVYPFSPTFHWKGFQTLAGPYISMLLTASQQVKDSLGVLTTNNSVFGTAPALSNYRQKIDAGFVLGVEYEFTFGISIGARYTQGFVPLFENAAAIPVKNAPEQRQQNVFNKSLSISVGYSFGKRKADPPVKH